MTSMLSESTFQTENMKRNIDIARNVGWKLRRYASTEDMAEIIAALLYKRSDRYQVLDQAKDCIQRSDSHT